MRAVVADDSVLMREGIAHALTEGGFEVVASVGDGAAAIAAVAATAPDVVVIDICMPPTFTDEGVRAAHAIRQAHPDVGVVVLSMHAEAALARELLLELPGRVGYLLKDRVADLDSFIASVRQVAAGGTALDPTVVQPLIGRPRNRPALEGLTPEERRVLELLMEGRTDAEIAERLTITERAAAMAGTTILAKLSVKASHDHRRRAAALLAYLGA